MSRRRVCFPGHRPHVGGPRSFQRRLAACLRERSIDVTFDLDDPPYDAILIAGGTRRIGALLKRKWRGVRVVQRLDGVNWHHRLDRRDLRHNARAVLFNADMRLIYRFLADAVVFQSDFTRDWVIREFGRAPERTGIIHNGVDPRIFAPPPEPPARDKLRIMAVEGRWGLEQMVRIPIRLGAALADIGIDAEIRVAGVIPDEFAPMLAAAPHIRYLGVVEEAELIRHERECHMFLSSELNPPCPNSVIEAMACGLPVVGFHMGSLPELVPEEAGVCAPYGGDPWAAEAPDVGALAKAAARVWEDLERYRHGARENAERRFTLEKMTDAYCEILF